MCGSHAAADLTETLEIQEIQIVKQTDVRFPATMRSIGVKEGNVSLVIAVDQNGALQDTFILKSSRNAFTKSALKSIGEWEFSPASCNGTPINSALRIDLSFRVDRKLTWQTFQAPMETNVTRSSLEEKPITASLFGELDEIPLPIEIIEPEEVVEGNATIEFYIDEMGSVRCPRLTNGSSLEFGQTMLDTVALWRFEPPVAEGARTNTMVRQTFTFANGRLTAAKAE
ncbi:hypothetical protein VDG1235_3931 [Verrucomicrobiia bacterium DG1235]|nr:hypothetical protein VDG1235_3931 [Verrucomicrobiae bacterium DG1235]